MAWEGAAAGRALAAGWAVEVDWGAARGRGEAVVRAMVAGMVAGGVAGA